MVDELNVYLQGIGARAEVSIWLNTAGKKALSKGKTTVSEMEHILDYLNSSAAPKRFQKMSFEDAKRKTAEWTKTNQKKGRNLVDGADDIETVMALQTGFIVKLKSKTAYQREGFLMNHCLGGYSPTNDVEIYSYRDSANNPHATFEVRRSNKEIMQIKGKGNGAIHPRYINPVLEFLKFLGIKIRTHDMQNLGYYHIDKDHLEFLKTLLDMSDQVVEVNGEFYAI